MRVLTVAAMLSGCTVGHARTGRTASEATLAASLGGMLGASALAYTLPAHQEVILEGGFAFVPIALASAAVYVACDGMIPPTAPPPEDRARATAWELARDAKRAARTGDCAQVQAIELRVRELDLEIYARFLRDEIIRTCLGPAP
jgi:hypothetical protein